MTMEQILQTLLVPILVLSAVVQFLKGMSGLQKYPTVLSWVVLFLGIPAYWAYGQYAPEELTLRTICSNGFAVGLAAIGAFGLTKNTKDSAQVLLK
jgi:hypothetical protein